MNNASNESGSHDDVLILRKNSDIAHGEGPDILHGYTDWQIEKIYYKSLNLGQIGFLLALATFAGMYLFGYKALIILPFYLPPAYAALGRSGKWCFPVFLITNILLFIISLIFGNLLALIIHLFGIIICLTAKELFGPTRITHAQIKSEMATRKNRKKSKG